MFKKFQEYLTKKQEAIKKEQELRKAQAYYRLVKAGNAFVAFVREDLKKNQEQVNRHMRRRMLKEIDDKGLLSDELVQYYSQKIDFILGQIHQRLNSKIKNSDVQISKEKPADAK